MLHEKDKESYFLLFFIQQNCDNLEKRWLRKDLAIDEKIKTIIWGVILQAEATMQGKKTQIKFIQLYSSSNLYRYSLKTFIYYLI